MALSMTYALPLAPWRIGWRERMTAQPMRKRFSAWAAHFSLASQKETGKIAGAMKTDQPTTEMEWLQAAAGGDWQAFAELIRMYEQPVFRLVYQLTRSHEDTEDIAQDAFIKAFEAIEQYDRRWPFRAWLFAIARNTAINWLKKRNRTVSLQQSASDEDDAVDRTDRVMDNQPGADRLEDSRRFQQALRAALDELPQQQAAAFQLRHMEDMSMKEIALALNISESNAKVSLHRARNALRVALKEFWI